MIIEHPLVFILGYAIFLFILIFINERKQPKKRLFKNPKEKNHQSILSLEPMVEDITLCPESSVVEEPFPIIDELKALEKALPGDDDDIVPDPPELSSYEEYLRESEEINKILNSVDDSVIYGNQCN